MTKKFSFLLPLVGFVFLFTTGASLIDKETKTHVMGLDDKMEMVKRQESSHHAELMKTLKDEREQVQLLMQRVDALQRQTSPALSAPAAPPQAAQETASEVAPAAVPAPATAQATASAPTPAAAQEAQAPSVTPGPENATKTAEHASDSVKAPEPAPAAVVITAPDHFADEKEEFKPAQAHPAITEAKTLEVPAPVVAAVKAPEPSAVPAVVASVSPLAKIATEPLVVSPAIPPQQPAAVAAASTHKGTSTDEILTSMAFFIATFSVILMLILLVRIKKGEDRIRKMIWKSEMGALREELSQVRPQKPANPKIQVTGNLPKVNIS